MKLIRFVVFVVYFIESNVFGQPGKVCICFTGQGVPFVEVANDFRASSEDAENVVEEADTICGFRIGDMISGKKSRDFSQADKAQIGLVATQLAIFEGLKENFPELMRRVKFSLGQSLGNYSAIYVSECVSRKEILWLVNQRGLLTKKYVDEKLGNQFSWIFIKGIKKKQLKELIGTKSIYIAGENTKEFFSVIGRNDDVNKLKNDLTKLKENASNISFLISKGIPFHSPLMSGLIPVLSEAFDKVHLNNPGDIKYISDASGCVYDDWASIKRILLGKQLLGPMKWAKEVSETLKKESIKYVLIIGAGECLQEIIQENNPEIEAFVIRTPSDAEKAQNRIKEAES